MKLAVERAGIKKLTKYEACMKCGKWWLISRKGGGLVAQAAMSHVRSCTGTLELTPDNFWGHLNGLHGQIETTNSLTTTKG